MGIITEKLMDLFDSFFGIDEENIDKDKTT